MAADVIKTMRSDATAARVARPGLRTLLVEPHAVRRERLRSWLRDRHEVYVAADAEQALEIAKEVIPSVLVVDVATDNAACLIEQVLEEFSVFEIGVMLVMDARYPVPSEWTDYVHLRRPFTKKQMLHCLDAAASPHLAPAAMLRRERQRREEAETLLDLALDLTSKLDLQELLQRATHAATQLTGAAFGAFFYNSTDDLGQRYLLYTLSGAPIEAFERFGTPRNTPLFSATFTGERIVRCHDVMRDPLYGAMGPHHGMPDGHLPVRSYLAVPVVSQIEVLGGLFFGHPKPGMFTQRSERFAAAIAAQAAVAIENSRLFSILLKEKRT